jgi:hypothetical protein
MISGSELRSVARMKHLLSAALGAAAVLAVVAATASGHASGTTITLVQHDSSFQFVDIAPKGGAQKPPSQGDEYVIGGTDTENGKPAGRTSLVCTITRPGAKGLSQCVGTLILPRGTISASGVSYLATNSDTYAVTGGTGAYVGARGTLYSIQGKGDSTDLVVRLS